MVYRRMLFTSVVAAALLAFPAAAQDYNRYYHQPQYSSLLGSEWRMLNYKLYDEQPEQFERALLQVSAPQRLAYSQFLDTLAKRNEDQLLLLVHQLIERGDVAHARFISMLARLTSQEHLALQFTLFGDDYVSFDPLLDLIVRDEPKDSATALRAVWAHNLMTHRDPFEDVDEARLEQLASMLPEYPDYHRFAYFGPGITMGSEISILQVPFQAQLYRAGAVAAPFTRKELDIERGKYGRTRTEFERWHACGAVLLHDNWVLTSAHCVTESDDYPFLANRRIRTGADSLLSGGTTWKILGAVRHGGYDSDLKVHDIALLKIAADDATYAERARRAQPARLPRPNDPALRDKEDLWVSGFGVTGVSEVGAKYRDVDGKARTASPLLLSAQLRNVPIEECNRHPGFVEAKLIVSAGQICAVGAQDHADSCQGDSGGPLRRKVEDETVVIGLVQTGRGCGLKGYPGVYVDLRSYVGWVEQAKRRMQAGKIIDWAP